MKFNLPVEITAEYLIVTPMFLGGADQQADDQVFRNASLKGALRFWWRAINWGPILSAESGNTKAALQALNKREGELFGTATDASCSGQSKVQLHTTLQDCSVQQEGLNKLNYLLGQGLYHFRDGLLRPFLSGGRLELTARFKPGTPQTDIDSVSQALTALGLFGGLGSRARKGFGSLAIQWLNSPGGRQAFTGLPAIAAFIATLDFTAPTDAPLSALTTASRLDASLSGAPALNLLSKIGTELQEYRSYGKNGKVNGKPARRNFIEDHDNALAAAQGKPIAQLPKRAVFGLPHNYRFSSGPSLQINPQNNGRRASPLFIHIHQFPDGQCVAIQILLPGNFLPANTAVELKGKGHRPNLLRTPQVDYQVIHEYLDNFKQKKGLRDGQ
ncbi:CRISPR-associated protein, Cmr1 family [Pseudomonas pohangensis]|uniref:CRISPR-associated protein, Cmr1 family n=1 Tax=Pseudomonas pohangensis TaxID=364197 RepID=A0A1H2G1E9_9PSED|nr:type III-B CRISPR module RAMP protein Cmr1 [Pseudomonas pohangensis]SDU13385.1 CRISPR-associated protein, Cmr1 family [Pseudomonas pohangensis]